MWLQGGIHPGDALEDWVHEQLAANGAGTLAGLKGKCDLSEINFKQDVLDNDSASSGVSWEQGPCRHGMFGPAVCLATGSPACGAHVQTSLQPHSCNCIGQTILGIG